MTPELKYKAGRCGVLLAQSPLADEIKNAVIENIVQMTDAQLDQVIKSLERETLELTSLTELLKEFDKKQDDAWINLEQDQQKLADKLVEEALQKVG